MLHTFEGTCLQVVLNILLKLVTMLSTTLQGTMKMSQGCHNNVVEDLDMLLHNSWTMRPMDLQSLVLSHSIHFLYLF